MTTSYDPQHVAYTDEADVRTELTRVFDVCQGCRRCTDLCPSFPTLFNIVDRHQDRDAGRLTPAQQDQVVDGCFQCKLCAPQCPYTPDLHELAVDFPRLMLRADAMRHANKQVSIRVRVTDAFVGRSDVLGTVATRTGKVGNTVANTLAGAEPGGLVRKAMQAVTGVSAVRVLAPFTRQRFTTWFKHRPKVRIARRQGRVAVYPTCLVEYQQPQIGHDLVRVYERNGIECSLSETVKCCGAAWLHSGDVDKFSKVAKENVAALAKSVRKGHDIVVPQPTCGYVLKYDYPVYASGFDAQLVADHTFDATEYLMKVHKGEGTHLDTDFSGFVPDTVAYHTPCHLRAQQTGLHSRDLIKLTGAKVKLVQQCSGVGAMWGLRAENDGTGIAMAAALADKVHAAGGDVVVGDCHLANTAISEQTGEEPMHPLQLIARAYGIAEEGER